MSAPDGYAPEMLSPAVNNLVAQLTRLPGIGSRTAQRLAFHLLQVPKQEALALADAVGELLGDREALTRARAGAARAREELTWDAAARAHMALYAELL